MEPEAQIEVVYALPEQQYVVRLPFVPGLTARAAVERSGLLERCPEILVTPLVLGIYGTRVEAQRRLEAGDRVEICRPLVADPRQMRRALLEAGQVMGGAPEPRSARKPDRA